MMKKEYVVPQAETFQLDGKPCLLDESVPVSDETVEEGLAPVMMTARDGEPVDE